MVAKARTLDAPGVPEYLDEAGILNGEIRDRCGRNCSQRRSLGSSWNWQLGDGQSFQHCCSQGCYQGHLVRAFLCNVGTGNPRASQIAVRMWMWMPVLGPRAVRISRCGYL